MQLRPKTIAFVPVLVVPVLVIPVLVAALVVLATGHQAAATTKADALAACERAMTSEFGATRIANIRYGRRRGTRRVVHGVMDRPGQAGVRFKCWVRSRQFEKLEVQTASGNWTPARRVEVDEDDSESEPEATEQVTEQNRLAPAEPERFKVNWGESYSPEEGVTCYKKRAACFDTDDKLLIEWTRKEFPQN